VKWIYWRSSSFQRAPEINVLYYSHCTPRTVARFVPFFQQASAGYQSPSNENKLPFCACQLKPTASSLSDTVKLQELVYAGSKSQVFLMRPLCSSTRKQRTLSFSFSLVCLGGYIWAYGEKYVSAEIHWASDKDTGAIADQSVEWQELL
jgi:hypothetical protein